MDGWCLEGFERERRQHATADAAFPFVVGREPTCDLSIASAETTSRQHARMSWTLAACCD